MPNVNIPPMVRFIAYLVAAVGSVGVAYAVAKGYAGDAESAAWTSLVAVITGIAAANTNLGTADDEDGLTDMGTVVVVVLVVLLLMILLGVIR
jgi:hypothetical protein